MDSLSHSAHISAATDVIDPAKAWMVGVLVESDGSFRPAPAAELPQFGRRADSALGETLACTCPDYCELEHDAI